MNVTGNTILITGGGSGIGRGLAESFHKLGNQVIISGRGNKNLDETTRAFPGMKAYKVDLAQAESHQEVRGSGGGGFSGVERGYT